MEHPNLTRSLALLHLFSLVYLTLVHFSECCGLRESRSQRDRGASADERLQFSLVKNIFSWKRGNESDVLLTRSASKI